MNEGRIIKLISNRYHQIKNTKAYQEKILSINYFIDRIKFNIQKVLKGIYVVYIIG
jgi:hypothetical protein